MKNFFYFIVAVLLCAILAGGVFVTMQNNANNPPDSSQSDIVDDENNDGNLNEKPNGDDSSNEKPGDSSDTENNTPPDSSEDGNVEEDNTLKNPVNASAYIADGMEMVSGASIYLGVSEEEPIIRFTGKISGSLKTAVDNDSSKEMGFLVAPIEYFDEVNPNNYTYMDWMTAFEKAGKTVLYSKIESSNLYENGSNYMARFQLRNVAYSNINRKFVAMLVLKTTTGNATSYKYSAFAAGVDYHSNARSIAYVAAAALNANVLGMESFTEDDVARLKGYVNESVDLANGKAEATDDGSMYAFTTNITAPQTLSVGESLTITTTISPKVDVPAWYRSSDESIVEVDANGKVIAKAKGTAVIGVYVAGESYGITVTVS